MGRVLAALRAILTRLVFGTHGVVAIWQVTNWKTSPQYWYLSAPVLMLLFEGVFTLSVKRSQEWKWFCPSVFLYLSSVVPAIWLLELDKMDRRLKMQEETRNLSAISLDDLRGLEKIMGGSLLPRDLRISADTWVTLIEQLLALVLILGRWMLPKGDLSRDQLSQLLLVYIGTAADIIEFFDSCRDDKIAREPLLVFLTLGIWSWSLLQFTVVLSATKARKSRLTTSSGSEKEPCCAGCCSIDVWGIVLNILLQDAPFLGFRLLLITHYRIISYMNVFFTCKNTLVILLQLYRLYVVHSETRKEPTQPEQQRGQISIIALSEDEDTSRSEEVSDEEVVRAIRKQRVRPREKNKPISSRRYRQDTGYSTASSSHSSVRDGRKQHPPRVSAVTRNEDHCKRCGARDNVPRRCIREQSRRRYLEERA